LDGFISGGGIKGQELFPGDLAPKLYRVGSSFSRKGVTGCPRASGRGRKKGLARANVFGREEAGSEERGAAVGVIGVPY